MISNRIEAKRGCGYRKEGGLYIMGGKVGMPCGKLPIPLTICPCCGAGIKFSRGFAWIGSALIESHPCESSPCKNCPVWSGKIEKFGLMWVGEGFYKTPDEFLNEAHKYGISKRIAAIPKDFELGVDWILLAHRKAVPSYNKEKQEMELTPGIFQAFKPTHFEYVVTGEETDEELERMEKRGIQPVRVIKDTDAQLKVE